MNRHLAFEVAIGMNGMLWVQATDVEDCIIIRNAIINSLELDAFQTEAMVEILIEKMKLRKRS